MSNELQVIVKQVPGKIEFNYEEIRNSLASQMDLYNDIQLTEETSAEGKKDIATLRKIKKAIDDKRKEVKNDCLKPYTEFEKKAIELISLIDEPISLIDKQVKVFEEKKRTEKKAKIQEEYNNQIGDLEEYLPFTKIYDIKWENTSVSMKSIKEEIDKVVSSTAMAVETIQDMNSESVPNALDQYMQNLSLADAISYINRYEQQKAEILRKEEEKRKAEEERNRIAEEKRIKELERQQILEVERKRIVEENRIREEERARLAEEEKQKIIIEPNNELPPAEDDLEDAFTVTDVIEEVTEEEPFIIESFDNELPFVVVEERRQSIFTIFGTLEELEQVEIALKGIGTTYEREDV
jgi:hypothetical protein